MCETCYGFDWIIGRDGNLRRCPTCHGAPRQLTLWQFEAALAEIRLNIIDDDETDIAVQPHDPPAHDAGGDPQTYFEARDAADDTRDRETEWRRAVLDEHG
jgi:hypothetical protein